MSLLTRAAREHGTTVILVTHDARVAAYADREVIVRDGQVTTLTGAASSPRNPAVIPLGLRLTLSGGREALTRLAILAAAVGIGVGLLLTALAAINAVNAQNHRHAWLWTGTAQEPAGHAPAGTDPLWWSISGDNFGGRTDRPRRRGGHRPDVAGTARHPP